MPRITLEAAHKLGQDEALKRLKSKFEAARSKFGPEVNNLNEQWTDHTLNFSFHALGMGVKGMVKVEDQFVKLHADLPFAAKLIQGKIESHIRSELADLLS
jgi:putative polyhydroxyalkanoate system protein